VCVRMSLDLCVLEEPIIHRVITLYTKCLPLDVACKLWDLYCRDGESFLFRVALGEWA
jgi:hypothetical protein